MTIDWTINLTSVGTFLVFVAGLFMHAGALRSNYQGLRLDIVDLKVEIKKLGDVLTKLAVQESRLDRIEEAIKELRHGEGFVFPLRFPDGGGGAGGRPGAAPRER